MLCLTRKPTEKIYIGDDIVIHVLVCESGRVRLGIDAPRSVPVNREEVALAIKAGKAATLAGRDAAAKGVAS